MNAQKELLEHVGDKKVEYVKIVAVRGFDEKWQHQTRPDRNAEII